MHDFYCSNPNDMYNKILADRVAHFKNKKEGEIEMCAIMDKIANEIAINSIIEEYQYLGLSKDKVIIRIAEKYSLTENEAADKVNEHWK